MILSIEIQKLKKSYHIVIPGTGTGFVCSNLKDIPAMTKEAFEAVVLGLFRKRVSCEVALIDSETLHLHCEDLGSIIALQCVQALRSSNLSQAQIVKKLGWTSPSQLKTVTQATHEPKLSKIAKILDLAGLEFELRLVPKKDPKKAGKGHKNAA